MAFGSWWVMGVAHRSGSACATRYACVRHPVFDTTTCCRVEVYRDMHIITISEMTNALRMLGEGCKFVILTVNAMSKTAYLVTRGQGWIFWAQQVYPVSMPSMY